MTPDTITLALLLGGTVTGALIDLRVRRVPNALTLSMAAAGVIVAVAGLGRLGAGAALAGLAVGLLVMLPGYLIGATGAGDVKLLAAAGSLLGPTGALWGYLYTAIAGGIIALVVAAVRGRLRRTVDETAWLVYTQGANVQDIRHPQANNRFAYAPAIAIGTALVALGW
jgi:prepilin peptidase CpaA